MTDIWEPTDAEEALSIVLLTEYGLLDGPGVIDISLTEAVDRMRPTARKVIAELSEEGYEIHRIR